MRKTRQLIRLLGNHNRTFNDATRTQLTLHELGTLVEVAGNEAGFDVYSEYGQKIGKARNGKPRFGKMDCAWFPKGDKVNMAVAWEFDGQDVAKGHLKGSGARIGNKIKFAKSNAKIRVQALYSIRCRVLTNSGVARTFFEGTHVCVCSDVGLMGGELLQIVTEAKRRR